MPAIVSSPSRTFALQIQKIEMSTMTEIQEAIGRLRSEEKLALAVWLHTNAAQHMFTSVRNDPFLSPSLCVRVSINT